MAKQYVGNAFSLNMLNESVFYHGDCNIVVAQMDHEDASEFVANPDVESVVGHADVAAIMSADLFGAPIRVNRTTASLNKGDKLLVGQYSGPRLPEGATKLPEDAVIRWMLVTIE